MRGPGKGNTNNPNGRPKGIPNKTTKEMRQLILDVCSQHIGKANKTLAELDGKEFIDALAKLFSLVMPRQAEIEGKLPLTLKIEWTDPNGDKDTSDNETP